MPTRVETHCVVPHIPLNERQRAAVREVALLNIEAASSPEQRVRCAASVVARLAVAFCGAAHNHQPDDLFAVAVRAQYLPPTADAGLQAGHVLAARYMLAHGLPAYQPGPGLNLSR